MKLGSTITVLLTLMTISLPTSAATEFEEYEVTGPIQATIIASKRNPDAGDTIQLKEPTRVLDYEAQTTNEGSLPLLILKEVAVLPAGTRVFIRTVNVEKIETRENFYVERITYEILSPVLRPLSKGRFIQRTVKWCTVAYPIPIDGSPTPKDCR